MKKPRRVSERWVDAAPVRAHVEAMLALGSEFDPISTAAGVAKMTTWRLVNLNPERMLRANAEKLLALPVARYVSDRYRSERVDLPQGVRHGTRTGYQRGCGCEACTTAEKRYHAGRGGKTAPPTQVPAEPVRMHIEALVAAGCKPSWIAATAGVDYCTVYNVRTGKHPTMQRAKAEAILAVRSVRLTDWQYTDATRTVERVERMWRQGYSKAWMAEQLDVAECTIQQMRPGRRYCRVWLAKRVAELAAFVGDGRGVARDGKPVGKRGGPNYEPRAYREAKAS